MAPPFSPETRAATLAALGAADLDLVIIGGGITGAGVARDAALRGLRVALLERADWAAGTSSRSSKLIHGGVRYLQQGDVGLVRESAAERAVLRRIAPHLATPLRMVMPTHGRAAQAKLTVGLFAFARLATLPPDERHETWTAAETLAREPTLDGTRLHAAVTFIEYLTDDARLVLETVKGAHGAGALCVNHVEVEAVRVGAHGTEVTARDRLGGTTLTMSGRVVVNAAGPWVDEVRRRAQALDHRRLHLTKGIHLVVPHARLPVRHIVVMQARDRRSVFAVPCGEATYLGTTDTDYGPPADYPAVTADDADYLLDAANRTFVGPPLTAAEVTGAWAGLRPLLHEEGKRPSEISRRDEIMSAHGGTVLSVAGGKLTTHRRMAERVVDLALARVGRAAGPCRTDTVPLPAGAPGLDALDALGERLRARLPELPAGGPLRLVRLYGGACEDILARVDADRGAGECLPGGVLRAEVDHVLEEEMALTLADVLERRMRLLLFDPRQGLDSAGPVAEIVARRLEWDAARTAHELDAYRELAASLRRFS